MDFARINNRTIHYQLIHGSGPEIYVFINSLGTDLRIWEKVAARLKGSGSVLLYDKPGHGLSDTPPEEWSIEHYADDLQQLLRHLNIDKATVVGLSIGGMIALQFAAKYASSVDRLILCDTCGKIGNEAGWKDRIDTIRKHGIRYLSDAILGNWFSPSYVKNNLASLEGYRNMLTRTDAAGYTIACAAIRDADLRPLYPAIKMPALCICGSDDRSTPPEMVRGMSEALPDARFKEIQNAGHLPCIDQPEVLAGHILDFKQDL